MTNFRKYYLFSFKNLYVQMLYNGLFFSFELGSGPANITYNARRVDDGRPHTVIVKRYCKRYSVNRVGLVSILE